MTPENSIEFSLQKKEFRRKITRSGSIQMKLENIEGDCRLCLLSERSCEVSEPRYNRTKILSEPGSEIRIRATLLVERYYNGDVGTATEGGVTEGYSVGFTTVE